MQPAAIQVPRVLSLPDLRDRSMIASQSTNHLRFTSGNSLASTLIDRTRKYQTPNDRPIGEALSSVSDQAAVNAAFNAESLDSRYVPLGQLTRDLDLPKHLAIEGLLGQGAMGTVYRAWDRQICRHVALKVSHCRPDSRSYDRFRREMLATARVTHSTVAPIFEHFCSRDRACFTMQVIEGNTFEEIIEAGSLGETNDRYCALFSPTALAQKFADLAEGLDAAHSVGVIHRDIKPSNLMLDQAERPWLLDFGLARLSDQVQLTRSGEIVGSVRYMSPEQLRGQTNLTPATDIYSLGITLRECLLGTTAAFDHECQASGDQLFPRVLRSIIAKATAECPMRRYRTAYQFAMDLRQFAESQLPLFVTSASKPLLCFSATAIPHFLGNVARTTTRRRLAS